MYIKYDFDIVALMHCAIASKKVPQEISCSFGFIFFSTQYILLVLLVLFYSVPRWQPSFLSAFQRRRYHQLVTTIMVQKVLNRNGTTIQIYLLLTTLFLSVKRNRQHRLLVQKTSTSISTTQMATSTIFVIKLMARVIHNAALLVRVCQIVCPAVGNLP